MKPLRRLLLLNSCAWLFCFTASAAEPLPEAKPLLTKPGKLLFSDDFSQVPHERDKQNKVRKGWMSGKGKWAMKDGVLVGAENPEDHHGAMLTKPALAFHNAAIEVSFRLDGAKGITLDANSFALGRIIAASVSSTELTLSRSLGGGDKLEVLDKLPLKLEAGTWHVLLLEMQGADVVASIDGKQSAFGTGERIDVDKTSVQFRIRGESVAFKNLRVWEATPADTWQATKTKLLEERKSASGNPSRPKA
jgi:hypothetical protein